VTIAHLVILWSAARLVPRSRRAEWLVEWRSELWYVLQKSNLAEGLLFCLGAFRDAVWVRRNCSPRLHQGPWLESPLWCLLFLAGIATLTATFFFRLPGPSEKLIRAHSLILALALLVLPAVTSLSLGEYPASEHSPVRAKRLRRWLYLATKFGLIVPIVFCGTFDLGTIVSATGLQPHATLIGYVLAFRWALTDQRRRCPVCLRLLTNPISIGQPAQTFLDWYGTEFFCVKGHGLLHVPEIATSYSTQRWLDLDPSWSGLFS